jgi:hypothetical protein
MGENIDKKEDLRVNGVKAIRESELGKNIRRPDTEVLRCSTRQTFRFLSSLTSSLSSLTTVWRVRMRSSTLLIEVYFEIADGDLRWPVSKRDTPGHGRKMEEFCGK